MSDQQELLDYFGKEPPTEIILPPVSKSTRLAEILFEGFVLFLWLYAITYLTIPLLVTIASFTVICCKDILGGKSIIKRIQPPNLKVVRYNSGKTPTPLRLMIRNIIGIFLFLFDILFVLLHPKNRRLVDLLVNTTVVIDQHPRTIAQELEAVSTIAFIQAITFYIVSVILLVYLTYYQ